MCATEPTNAESPFDPGNKRADIILRSSDLVDFHAIKLILIMTSTIFADMFSLPQNSTTAGETKDGLPIVQMQEESHALYPLLLYCCSRGAFLEKCKPDTIEGGHTLLEISHKFAVESLERWALTAIADLSGHNENLRVFALAVFCGHEEEACLAIKKLLSVPLCKEKLVPELEMITAGDFFQMEQYRRACVAAAGPVVAGESAHSTVAWDDFNCIVGSCADPGSRRPLWLKEYLMSISCAVKERPCGEAVVDENFMERAKKGAYSCSVCVRRLPVFYNYTAHLVQEVDRVISLVSGVIACENPRNCFSARSRSLASA